MSSDQRWFTVVATEGGQVRSTVVMAKDAETALADYAFAGDALGDPAVTILGAIEGQYEVIPVKVLEGGTV